MENQMKEVFAITNKCRKIQKHILFGIDKVDLDRAKMFTRARLKINWENFTWGLLCTEETYEYIKKHLMFDGFDPYEIVNGREIQLREMKDMHFYKEVEMISQDELENK